MSYASLSLIRSVCQRDHKRLLGICPDVLEKIISTVPVKRLGKPSEIASMVSWLAGEESAYSTGADFSVNGGLHIG